MHVMFMGYVFMDSICDMYITWYVLNTPKIYFYTSLQCGAKDWKVWELG